jgi:hypothetical protein
MQLWTRWDCYILNGIKKLFAPSLECFTKLSKHFNRIAIQNAKCITCFWNFHFVLSVRFAYFLCCYNSICIVSQNKSNNVCIYLISI